MYVVRSVQRNSAACVFDVTLSYFKNHLTSMSVVRSIQHTTPACIPAFEMLHFQDHLKYTLFRLVNNEAVLTTVRLLHAM